MVGARFRPQGNDPATGLDCVGLVWAAYAAAGRRLVRPGDYPLRGWGLERIEGALAVAGFVRADDAMRAGDVVLIAHQARPYHLGLIGSETFIHAHEIGRASCREQVCQYGWIVVGGVSLKTKKRK